MTSVDVSSMSALTYGDDLCRVLACVHADMCINQHFGAEYIMRQRQETETEKIRKKDAEMASIVEENDWLLTHVSGPFFPADGIIVSVPESNIQECVCPVLQVFTGGVGLRIRAPAGAFKSRLHAKGQFMIAGEVRVETEGGQVSIHDANFVLRFDRIPLLPRFHLNPSTIPPLQSALLDIFRSPLFFHFCHVFSNTCTISFLSRGIPASSHLCDL